MAIINKALQQPSERALAPYLKDTNFTAAIVEATVQGHVDSYNLGTQFRTRLSIGLHTYAQVAFNLMSVFQSAEYSGLRSTEKRPHFQFNSYQSQARIEIRDVFPSPIRLLLRRGRLSGSYFEVDPLGSVTYNMLMADHGIFGPRQGSLLESDSYVRTKETDFIDLYVIYDWVISQNANPYLSIYLAFPLPCSLRGRKLSCLDLQLLRHGQLGTENIIPGDMAPPSGAGDVDFDVQEKNIVGM